MQENGYSVLYSAQATHQFAILYLETLQEKNGI